MGERSLISFLNEDNSILVLYSYLSICVIIWYSFLLDVPLKFYLFLKNLFKQLCEVLKHFVFKNTDSKTRMPGFKVPVLPFGSYVPPT